MVLLLHVFFVLVSAPCFLVLLPQILFDVVSTPCFLVLLPQVLFVLISVFLAFWFFFLRLSMFQSSVVIIFLLSYIRISHGSSSSCLL